MRGQDLSALQGNQQTQLGARGQNITQELGLAGTNAALRGQDANVMMSDADRQMAAQQLALQGQLGFGGLANDATGQGLNFLGQANQQQIQAEALAQDAANNVRNNNTSIANTNTMADAGIINNNNTLNAQPSVAEQLIYTGLGGVASGFGGGLAKRALA
jgi:hypothetical protein